MSKYYKEKSIPNQTNLSPEEVRDVAERFAKKKECVLVDEELLYDEDDEDVNAPVWLIRMTTKSMEGSSMDDNFVWLAISDNTGEPVFTQHMCGKNYLDKDGKVVISIEDFYKLFVVGRLTPKEIVCKLGEYSLAGMESLNQQIIVSRIEKIRENIPKRKQKKEIEQLFQAHLRMK